MRPDGLLNVIANPLFHDGLSGWMPLGCQLAVVDSPMKVGCEKLPPVPGDLTSTYLCVASNRTEPWQGIAQEIGGRLRAGTNYELQALVSIVGNSEDATVLATLKLEGAGVAPQFITVAKCTVCKGQWTLLKGNLRVEQSWTTAVLYVEGPLPGATLVLAGLVVTSPHSEQMPQVDDGARSCSTFNVIQNWNFEFGLNGWYSNGCQLSFSSAHNCAIVSNRTAEWQGIQQDISGHLQANVPYEVMAAVRLRGSTDFSPVLATLYIQDADGTEQYISMGRVDASANDWVKLTGRLVLYKLPSKAIAYLEGPPCGVDILVRSFAISPQSRPTPAEPPSFDDPKYGVNIVENSTYSNRLECWSPVGSCQLYVSDDGPRLDVQCLVATNRNQVWEGPVQNITKRIQVYLTYQVSAWVRVAGAVTPQKVNVALGVDGKWVNGGEVEVDPSGPWTQVNGSFRLESPREEVVVYLQGPDPGVDMMLAGLHISAVDHRARIALLKEASERVRQREVILTLRDSSGRVLPSQAVLVQQMSNSFPLGSCINRRSLYNPSYAKFFLNHFNWAVFENEMKWTWTEPIQGQLNYKDADELLDFCSAHSIPVRGHCIFWEVEDTIQGWLKQASRPMLSEAVDRRIVELLSRYKGKFKHYDVNNEMLHGSFYRDRLGYDVIPYMFKRSSQCDPCATLFVNDYHIEDGCDAGSSPTKCVQQVLNLRSRGAPVGGIGVQGHADAPVGAIICQSLDTLSSAGVPIWFTEVDVASCNEYIRADDLEVILREAFAHRAVEGVLLWGFWEGSMSREQAHLVNWDMGLTEAGRRFVALKQEWLTNISSNTNGAGQIKFRGFLGQYDLEVAFANKRCHQKFVVTQGEGPSMIDIVV